jgi:uncharacterized protein
MTHQPTDAASADAAPGVVMAAMPLDELDRWLRGRTQPRPVAENVAMFDGYITAIVAGPVSLPPLDWICPLLGVAPDAYNDGSTPEFAAIGAVAERHNVIQHTVRGARAVCADLRPHRQWRRRCRALVPRLPCGNAVAPQGMAPPVDHRPSRQRLAAADPVPLHRCRRPNGARGATARATRRAGPPRSRMDDPVRRRGHAPVLDADALQNQDLIRKSAQSSMPSAAAPVRNTLAGPT